MTTAKRLDKYGEYVYPVVRIIVGFLFACHGAQKLFGVLGSQPEIHDPEGLVAGLIEFFGGSLVALGLGARAAAFLASGEMAVAYFKAHAPRGLWPILNGGERAVFYCFFFLYVAAHGPGRMTLESVVQKLRKRGGVGPSGNLI
ncbi:MAG: DoxX family protein [Acidobacteria bacterium]|nr:MAG: DoxX family protein [Acidobacteriota bacterium]PYU46879.1 MAG: DoxX family protein [Acidobacteriota bacterium]PYU73375.1 MAG: DoxX family protein [Acidobacteriota bacterium]